MNTDAHGGNLAIGRRSISCLSDSKVEERQKAEDIRQRRVEPVIVGSIVIADTVEFCH